MSLYGYVSNNPLRFFDPNGEEIWIYYQDEDNKEKKMLYSTGMKYDGNNEFLSKSISYLNTLNENGGEKVLGELIKSSNKFNIKNLTVKDDKGQTLDAMRFDENAEGGGDILAGVIMNPKISEYSNVESMSHELFHGIQYESGQGGASIFNEVEAYVYSGIVTTNWAINNDYYGSMSSNGLGTNSATGKAYQQAFNGLLSSFSKQGFIDAVKNFKAGSEKTLLVYTRTILFNGQTRKFQF